MFLFVFARYEVKFLILLLCIYWASYIEAELWFLSLWVVSSKKEEAYWFLINYLYTLSDFLNINSRFEPKLAVRVHKIWAIWPYWGSLAPIYEMYRKFLDHPETDC